MSALTPPGAAFASEQAMRITLACPGAGWGGHLAGALLRAGALHRWITGDARPRGLNLHGRTVVVGGMARLAAGLPARAGLVRGREYLEGQAFDWSTRRHINGSGVLVVCSGSGLHAMREAKAHDIVTVLYTGRAHAAQRRAVIQEERRRFGLPDPAPDEQFITKQLWEYGEADYVLAPTRYIRESFESHDYPAERLLPVPLGCDPRIFTPGAPRDATFRVVAAAGVSEGVRYLVDALRDLDRGDVELVLLGGADPETRRLLAGSGVRVRLAGRAGEARTADILRAGSVWVDASIDGGDGTATIAALACGLPAVCTVSSAGPDVIREGEDGFVVPARDPAALRGRLRELYDHPDTRTRMAGAAAARAGDFTWDACAERMTREFRRILAAPSRARAAEGGLAGFYDYLWQISDVWGSNSAWDDRTFRRHFEGVLRSGDVVLDIGCGDARSYHRKVMETARELHGIDISTEAVARALRKGVRARTHDISTGALPYPDGTFDLITCFEVLEHLLDPKSAVRAMYRALRPGGRLLVSVPNAGYFRERLITLSTGEVPAGITDFANPWMAPHIRFFTRGKLTALLRAAGFTVERVRGKGNTSLLDGLDMLGGPGRFLARQVKRRLPSGAQGAFLGDLWPALFADGLLVLARRPDSGLP